MGRQEPESWYKRKGDAEAYARFYSSRKQQFKAVPAKGGGYKLKRVPKGVGALERIKKRLEPRAKRGRAGVVRAVKKRVRKATRRRKSPTKRKTIRKTRRRSPKRTSRRRRRRR